MTSNQELQLRAEQEPYPRVQGMLFAFAHAPINAQAIPEVYAAAEEYFQGIKGRKILFLERALGVRSQVETDKRIVWEQGYATGAISQHMYQQFGRLHTREEVEARIRKIRESSLEEVVTKRLVPFPDLQNPLLSIGFDELVRRYGIEYEFESHSEQALQNIDILRKRESALTSDAKIYWNSGEFDNSLNASKTANKLFQRFTELKDQDTIADGRRLIKELLKEKDGGGIFFLFGAKHIGIGALNEIFAKNPDVRFTTRIAIPPHHPLLVITRGLSQNSVISETVYAQGLLHSQLINEIQVPYKQHNAVIPYIENWETIEADAVDLVVQLSFDEIRDICQSRQPVLQVLADRVAPLLRHLP